MSNVFEVKKDIYFTGVVDKDLEVFDIIIRPKGRNINYREMLLIWYYISEIIQVRPKAMLPWGVRC